MPTTFVALGTWTNNRCWDDDRQCPVPGPNPSVALLTATPGQRTIHYQNMHHDGLTLTASLSKPPPSPPRYYRVAVPHLRILLGVTRQSDGSFRWTQRLNIYGSTEPFTSTHRPVFALPFPNIRVNGQVCMGGGPAIFGRGTLDDTVQGVLSNFWGSMFTYFLRSGFPGPDDPDNVKITDLQDYNFYKTLNASLFLPFVQS